MKTLSMNISIFIHLNNSNEIFWYHFFKNCNKIIQKISLNKQLYMTKLILWEINFSSFSYKYYVKKKRKKKKKTFLKILSLTGVATVINLSKWQALPWKCSINISWAAIDIPDNQASLRLDFIWMFIKKKKRKKKSPYWTLIIFLRLLENRYKDFIPTDLKKKKFFWIINKTWQIWNWSLTGSSSVQT